MASLRQCPMLLLALVLTTFTSFSITPVLSTDAGTQSSIDQICNQMEDHGFCNKLYQDKLKGASSDMHGLAKIAQQEAINQAAQIRLTITDLLGKPSTGPDEKKALSECQNSYNTVIYQFQKAWFYFDKIQSYKDVLDIERPAPRAQASCDATFAAPPQPPNPISEQNRESRILIAMALVSTSYLTK